MAEEIFDVVNERDEVVGQAPRLAVHSQNLLHRAIHVFVFDSTGRLFLQKRSMAKDCFPGTWDSSASGHCDQGEGYDRCARRELQEELGLVLDETPRRLFKVDACPQTGYEFVWLYETVSDGPFELQASEIDDGGWYTRDELDAWIADRRAEFAPSFPLLWERYWDRNGRA